MAVVAVKLQNPESKRISDCNSSSAIYGYTLYYSLNYMRTLFSNPIEPSHLFNMQDGPIGG